MKRENGMKEKDYIIARKRIVCQICIQPYTAKSQKEALDMANKEQTAAGSSDDGQEWEELDDIIDYPTLDKDDIMEVVPTNNA